MGDSLDHRQGTAGTRIIVTWSRHSPGTRFDDAGRTARIEEVYEDHTRSSRRVRDLERRESPSRRKARAREGAAFRGAEGLLRSADGPHRPHSAPGDAT